MSFFKNRHVITAMFVAPVLAIASYYLVDLLVGERAAPAVSGASYALIAKSNCRFSSGVCDLVNAEFKSTLRVVNDGSQQRLNLNSSHALQSAMVGFVDSDGVASEPVALTSVGDDEKSWSIDFSAPATADTSLRIALRANDAHYFAETKMSFSDYQTSFDQDFRKNSQ